MTEHISKARQRAVGLRRRQSQRAAYKPPFKDGAVLGALYYLLLLVLTLATLVFAHPVDSWIACGPLRPVGALVLASFAILGMRILLSMLAADTMARNSRHCMVCLICLLPVLITGGLVYTVGPEGWLGEPWRFVAPFFYPYLLAPILGTLLLGAEVGVAVGFGTSLLMALFLEPADQSLALLLGLFATIVVPQLIHRRIRRRMQLLRVSLAASIVLTVGVYLYPSFHGNLMDPRELCDMPVSPILLQSTACLLSGGLCALLALALMPLFEHLFAATSHLTLQSFADLGHPLLERLSLEAPGTYNHSITMATLCATAAERIGANALLARVGAYYHDIGKLSTPGLFIENTTPDRNPHRTLNPGTSASWIRSHVKDGIVLAQRFRLPPPLKNMIWEHHGTTAIAVFLHKAREQAKAEVARQPRNARRVVVEESQFRYPGPRPRTRESALLMLADSVEAAARSLEKPTPVALEKLVSDIFESKLKDEQLDDCPLSLRDLAIVKRSFVASLSTILHARIPYPNQTPPDSHEPPDEPAAEDREPPDALPPEPSAVP